MAAGYDGTIRIDTRIDTDGFNEGTNDIEENMKRIQKSIEKSIGDSQNTVNAFEKVGSQAFRRIISTVQMLIESLKVIAVVAVALTLVLGIGLIVAIKALLSWAQKMTDTLYKNLSVTSAMRDKVVQLKGAYDGLKGSIMAMGATLLNALAPVLLKIIDWLTQVVNWVSMFIAALTGQKTVMQYVSGAVDAVAGSTGKAADNTKKLTKATKDTEKAAKGALAAFDEINVLQTDTAKLAEDIADPMEDIADLSGGGGAVGGNIVMQEVEVPENFLTNFKENIKTKIAEAAADIDKTMSEILPGIWGAGKGISQPQQWLGNTEYVKEQWSRFKTWFDGQFGETSGFDVKGTSAPAKWLGNTEYVKEQWNRFQAWFNEKFSTGKGESQINQWLGNGSWLKEKWGETWKTIETNALSSWQTIKQVWNLAPSWFKNNIIDPISNAFNILLKGIKDGWETTFEGVKTFVKTTINSIIDFLNGMIRGITTGINTVIRSLNSLKINMPDWLGGGSFGLNIPLVYTPQIPRLATGAVIPPNAEFAAILGDQRSGRNLEAPEGLIRQIIQEELGNIEINTHLEFGGSLGALIRELKPYIDKENVRVGKSLIRSGVVS